MCNGDQKMLGFIKTVIENKTKKNHYATVPVHDISTSWILCAVLVSTYQKECSRIGKSSEKDNQDAQGYGAGAVPGKTKKAKTF